MDNITIFTLEFKHWLNFIIIQRSALEIMNSNGNLKAKTLDVNFLLGWAHAMTYNFSNFLSDTRCEVEWIDNWNKNCWTSSLLFNVVSTCRKPVGIKAFWNRKSQREPLFSSFSFMGSVKRVRHPHLIINLNSVFGN